METRDPVETAPFEQRRGTLAALDYDSWEAMSIYVSGGIDAIADRLTKAKKVGLVQADVTKAALAGTLDQPDAPYLIIVKLRGHDWAPAFASFADRYDTDTARDLSRDAATKVIWCGHQDTASATGFELFERGQPLVQFETCGEEYIDDSSPDFPTRFKSATHKKNWWRQHADEDEALQALVKEQQAYVPMFACGGEKGKLRLWAFPDDTLEPDNIERIVLAIYGPAKKARPAASGKALREAIERMDVAAVEAAIKAGADQNYLPGLKETALAHAVNFALRNPEQGLPVIDALLRGGADVNDAGNGNPPVWEAFDGPQGKDRKLPILQRLIAAGADLNALAKVSHHKGDTPLHLIANSGDVEMARFLVAHGADVSAKNSRGETARQSASANLKTMLSFIDDEGGKHSGPIKAVIELLERVEKGKIKPSDLPKDAQPIVDAERARNEKLKAEINAVLANLENPFTPTDENKREKDEKIRAQRAAAKRAAVHAQPKQIRLKQIQPSDGRWFDVKRRDLAAAALSERGFEVIGEFEATPGFDFLRMLALVHRKQHIYAVVCEMIDDRWVDLVQYYSDGTQLNATNVKSLPEAQIDVPKQRKVREPKWGAAKLADWMLKQPPPAVAKVSPLKPDDFASHFEQDYAEQMRHRRGK
jgi:hypothetical protein